MVEWIFYSVVILLLFSGVISIFSLVCFSSILIKLIVVEIFTNLLVVVIALWALIYKQPIFIDICLTLALVMFLGVVAYYHFLFTKENVDANLRQ